MARQKNITARSLLEDQRGSAAQLLTDSGLDSWTRQKYDLQQSQQDRLYDAQLAASPLI